MTSSPSSSDVSSDASSVICSFSKGHELEKVTNEATFTTEFPSSAITSKERATILSSLQTVMSTGCTLIFPESVKTHMEEHHVDMVKVIKMFFDGKGAIVYVGSPLLNYVDQISFVPTGYILDMCLISAKCPFTVLTVVKTANDGDGGHSYNSQLARCITTAVRQQGCSRFSVLKDIITKDVMVNPVTFEHRINLLLKESRSHTFPQFLTMNQQRCEKITNVFLDMIHIPDEKRGAVGMQPKSDRFEETNVPEETTDLVLYLYGKSGSGKSSVKSALLGRQSRCGDKVSDTDMQVEGRNISVIDVQAKSSMTSSRLEPHGVHAVLFIMKISVRREVQHEQFHQMKQEFGDGILKHCLIVFTKKDTLDIHGISIEQHISHNVSNLQDLVKQCGNRYIAVNNKSEPDRGRFRKGLLSMVDKMLQRNGYKLFYPIPQVHRRRSVHREDTSNSSRRLLGQGERATNTDTSPFSSQRPENMVMARRNIRRPHFTRVKSSHEMEYVISLSSPRQVHRSFLNIHKGDK